MTTCSVCTTKPCLRGKTLVSVCLCVCFLLIVKSTPIYFLTNCKTYYTCLFISITTWLRAPLGTPSRSVSAAPVHAPRVIIQQHQAAVKALAWCPHQHNILASGGGTADRTIRIWNTSTGTNIRCTDTGSQVSLYGTLQRHWSLAIKHCEYVNICRTCLVIIS